MRHLAIFSILTLLLAACGFITPATPGPSPDEIGTAVQLTVTHALPPTQAPSATPAPASETPTPDSTATATATGTPLTPTAPATPDPQLNVGDEVYTDTFDGTSGWFWTFSDDIVEFGARDGELKVETKAGNDSWRFVVRSDIDNGNQQLRVAARTGTCPGNDEYGVMYRAQFDAEQKIHSYIFKLNCAGQARVERIDDTEFAVLRDWEAFSAIRPGAPAENVILIWMANDQFHFFVNDQFLFSLNDSSLDSGFYGFFVQSHSGGGASLSFDDMVVKEVQVD